MNAKTAKRLRRWFRALGIDPRQRLTEVTNKRRKLATVPAPNYPQGFAVVEYVTFTERLADCGRLFYKQVKAAAR